MFVEAILFDYTLESSKPDIHTFTQQIREVEPLLREPFQDQMLGDSHVLHNVNHLIIILLAFVGEPCIQPVENILREFTLLPLGILGFLLSSRGVAHHFERKQRVSKQKKVGFREGCLEEVLV